MVDDEVRRTRNAHHQFKAEKKNDKQKFDERPEVMNSRREKFRIQSSLSKQKRQSQSFGGGGGRNPERMLSVTSAYIPP